MPKQFLLVTIITNSTLYDYARLERFLGGIDWHYATPPTATQKILLCYTDKSYSELSHAIAPLIDSACDHYSVDPYDDKQAIVAHYRKLDAWLAERE